MFASHTTRVYSGTVLAADRVPTEARLRPLNVLIDVSPVATIAKYTTKEQAGAFFGIIGERFTRHEAEVPLLSKKCPTFLCKWLIHHDHPAVKSLGGVAG